MAVYLCLFEIFPKHFMNFIQVTTFYNSFVKQNK